MQSIRAARTTVTQFQLADIPRGVADDYREILLKAKNELTIMIDTASENDPYLCDKVCYRLIPLTLYPAQGDPDYQDAVSKSIEKILEWIHHPSFTFCTHAEQVKLLGYIATLLRVLRSGDVSGSFRVSLKWHPIVDRIFATYKSNSILDRSDISPIERLEKISQFNQILKHMIWFNPDRALIDFLIGNLQGLDFRDLNTIDIIEQSFSILSFFKAEDLFPLVQQPTSSLFWNIWNKCSLSSPPWFQPRLELYYLNVLAKLEPSHWTSLLTQSENNNFINQLLSTLVQYSLDHVGLPTSANTGTAASSATVEVTGNVRVPGTLLDYMTRQIVPKFGRLLVSLIWSSPEVSAMGWSILESLLSRSSNLFLIGATHVGSSDIWPANLADLIQSITHQWLRRTLKARFLNQAESCQPDHALFVALMAPGLTNVVKAFVSATVNATQLSIGAMPKFIVAYSDLLRIGQSSITDSHTIFEYAAEALSDVHKAIVHPLVVIGGIVPLSNELTSLSKDYQVSFLHFLLDYVPEAINSTNLFFTVIILTTLDIMLTQNPRGFTLHDLSCEPSGGNAIPANLAAVSTAFPNWSVVIVEKFLNTALSVPKLKLEALSGNGQTVSSETLEVFVSVNMTSVFVWIINNVDSETTLGRICEIFKEFLTRNMAVIEKGKFLIASMISELMRVCAIRKPSLATDWLSWLIESKIKPSSSVAPRSMEERHMSLWVYFAGQSLRYMGINGVEPFLDSLVSKCVTILLNAKLSLRVKKSAIKTIRRICESVCSIYIREFSNYIGGRPYQGTDWWTEATSSGVSWYNPMEEPDRVRAVLRKVQTLCQLVYDGVKDSHHLDLRLYRAISYGCRFSSAKFLDMDLGLPDFAAILLQNQPPNMDDNKHVHLWIKAVASTMPFSLRFTAYGVNDVSLPRTVIGQIAGFGLQNLQHYSYIAKDLEVLDHSRFDYLSDRLTKSIGMICTYTAGRACGGDAKDNREMVPILLKISFANLAVQTRLDCILIITQYMQSMRLNPNKIGKPEHDWIVDTLVSPVIDLLLGSEPITKYQAKTLSAIFQSHLIQQDILIDYNVLERMLDATLHHLALVGRNNTPKEISNQLIEILHHLWTTTLEKKFKPQHTERAIEYMKTLLGKAVHCTQWSLQLSMLIASYIVWLSHTTRNVETEAIVTSLCTILSTGKSTPLPTMLGRFLVHWLTMLLVHDNIPTIESLSEEALLAVAKIFSLHGRFEGTKGAGGAKDTEAAIDSLVRSIEEQGFIQHCSLLFNQGSIPRSSNKGIVEAHVVFWWLLGDGKSQSICSSIMEKVSRKGGRNENDDIHCTVLEFFASSCWNSEWEEILKAEITRGDSSLIPTIATAIRVSMTGLAAPTLIPNQGRYPVDWCVKICRFLLSNLEADTYRYLSVLNQSILSDSRLTELLVNDARLDFEPLMKWEKFSKATDQVREIYSAVIGRLARVSPRATDVIREELERLSADRGREENEGEIVKQKVLILKALGRLIRFSRELPDWALGSLPIAIDLVPSYQDDVRQVGTSFIDLLARFVGVKNAMAVPVNLSASAKEIGNVISFKSRVLVRLIERGQMAPLEAVAKFEENILIHPDTQPVALTAYRTGITDILVTMKERDMDAWQKSLVSRDRLPRLIGYCAIVSLGVVYHDLPPIVVGALRSLAVLLDEPLEPNPRKTAETTVSDLMKILTHRGTHNKVEKLLGREVLAVIKSGISKHAYIS